MLRSRSIRSRRSCVERSWQNAGDGETKVAPPSATAKQAHCNKVRRSIREPLHRAEVPTSTGASRLRRTTALRPHPAVHPPDHLLQAFWAKRGRYKPVVGSIRARSEEHTSELQPLAYL